MSSTCSPGIEFYAETALVKAQCETLVEEIAFVSAIVNDNFLRNELAVLRDAALRVVRAPMETLLLLTVPNDG